MSASSKKQLRKEQNAAELTEKQLAEQKEAKKLKAYTVTFVVIMALVVVIAVAALAIRGVTNFGLSEKTTIALTVDDHKLNSVEFSYFYMDAINAQLNEWYNSFGDYMSYYLAFMGLDQSKPLNEQVLSEEDGTTWADYFVEAANGQAKSTYALYDLAVEAGHTLTDAEEISIQTTVNNLNYYAQIYGYSSIDNYLAASYCNGANLDSFRDYLEVTALAQSYYMAYRDSLTYEDAAIREYESDRYAQYSSYSFSSCYLAYGYFLEGGTTDENGSTTYSDEENAAALEAAELAANSLVSADITSTEDMQEAVAALEVNKESETVKCNTYEYALYQNVDSTLQEWLTDPNRKAGDMDVIPSVSTSTDEDGNETTTTNGYYVIRFEDSRDNITNMVNVRHILISLEGGEKVDGVTVYSDEEKKAAYDKAAALLEEWKAGDATAESFGELANKNSTDTGSNTNGGLYEDVYPNQMVTAFNDWCFDPSRQPGDTGIVETEYGYHVMYFVNTDEMTFRDYLITTEMRTNDVNTWYSDLLSKVTLTKGDVSQINLDLILTTETTA